MVWNLLCKWGHLKVCFIHFIWVRNTLAHTHTGARTHIQTLTEHTKCATNVCERLLVTMSLTVLQLFEQLSRDCDGFSALYANWKSWSGLQQMEMKRWGNAKLNVQNGVNSTREHRLGRKICSKINGCYWEAFNHCSNSITLGFLLPSIYCGAPLIGNLVSCPLILKDVRLYNKVKSGAYRFILCQCQNILGNVWSFAIQFINHGGLMLLTAAEELHMTARASPCQRTSPQANSHIL